ncbi:hypothetical protein FJZ48_00490 [Candidatus Uhrbacteria bacterium]|nr:hypothetical protein [Candidatus Uhrbacteria bacterium]
MEKFKLPPLPIQPKSKWGLLAALLLFSSPSLEVVALDLATSKRGYMCQASITMACYPFPDPYLCDATGCRASCGISNRQLKPQFLFGTLFVLVLLHLQLFRRCDRRYRLDHSNPDVTWWRFLRDGRALRLTDEVIQITGDIFRILKEGTPFDHENVRLIIHFYSPPTVETVAVLMRWMRNLPPVNSPEFGVYVAQAAQITTRMTPHLPFWIEHHQKPTHWEHQPGHSCDNCW